MTSGAGIDGGVSGMAGGGRGMGSMLNTKTAASGMDINSPNSYSMVQAQGMMGMMPYMMSGGSAGGAGGGGHGVMGSGRMGTGSPNSFLPPPGEDTDQQELMRLQQTNYRVKMLPPPLTYEVHRKIWSRNEYGDEDDNEEDDVHGPGHGGAGGNVDQEHESSGGGSIANEDPIDKEQRLEAYKQIMLRWYSHIHVLEGKPEVAKRLVRVRRACPSMEEVVYSLTHPQQPGAALETEAGGDDEPTPTAVPPTLMAAAARRGSDGMPDMEEILATWSSRCWNWWQETVKRKPRRARKQGELPIAGGNGASGTNMPTTALPLAGMANGAVMPRNPSSRNMDMGDSAVPPPPPHLTGGGGGPYTYPSSYANHDGSGTAGGMPVVPSYKSFTDLSEEGMDGPAATSGSLSHYSPHHNDGGSLAPSQAQPSHPALPHDASPMASMFTVNGPRTATLRGTSEDFLENDHLTLAFTTELLKSLEE
uniref:Hypothetical_protein_conserved n=1 Tax=Leishmania donovani TaxID=5661 RepID=A0A6J8FAP3_LEIDO|nr:hypothetical_protein_conserved [Leishmania donovani]